MTNKNKQLLLKDLCARLPYGVRYKGDGGWGINPHQHTTSLCTILTSEEPLVYLRPMSSMTEEEEIYYNTVYTRLKFYEKVDWLNAHYLDYRGLIPIGLALEAKEGMYKTE